MGNAHRLGKVNEWIGGTEGEANEEAKKEHKEAEAEECVREKGGDEPYFKFHDAMFTKTTSNGTGLARTDLPGIADSVGANGQAMQSCLDAGKYTAEVDKDMAAAAAAGANATPSFFIGNSDASGTIIGTPIIDA